MALKLPTGNALSATEFERRGGEWNPHVHWIVPTHEPIEASFVQRLIDEFASEVEAYSALPIFRKETFCIELQFRDDDVGKRCSQKYLRAFRKGGEVVKTKQALATKPKKRLYRNRMYRLPDGELFWYFMKYDGHGFLSGWVYNSLEDELETKVVHRSVLEQAELIRKGKEPWAM